MARSQRTERGKKCKQILNEYNFNSKGSILFLDLCKILYKLLKPWNVVNVLNAEKNVNPLTKS